MTHILRRIAYLFVAYDQFRNTVLMPASDEWPISETDLPTDVRLCVVIAHWRHADPHQATSGEAVLGACLDGVMRIPTTRTDVIVLTNDAEGTSRGLARWSEARAPSPEGHGGRASAVERRLGQRTQQISVEEWRPRGLRRHGWNMPWGHKVILRRELARGVFSHFVYLEDDIGLTAEHFAYWLSARRALRSTGDIPGFLRYEPVGEHKFLVDHTRSGQYVEIHDHVDLEGLGPVTMNRSQNPYQGFYILDLQLAIEHFRRSPMRSQFRSRVCQWAVRERAASGSMFHPPRKPLLAFLLPNSEAAAVPTRHVFPLRVDSVAGTRHIPDFALVQHLRPRYSRDPTSPFAKVSAAEI